MRKSLVYRKSREGPQVAKSSGDVHVVHDMHYACGKTGRGQIIECLVGMAKYGSSNKEGILSVLLNIGFLAPRTVPVMEGNLKHRLNTFYFKCNSK